MRRFPFRRFADHLKSQQWLAVLIDIMIVVLGVFIGIQAANWNASRQDRQEERRYYEQIIADLDADLTTFSDARRFAEENDRAADFVLAGLADEAIARREPGRFASSMVLAGYLYFPAPARRTYDELISTGNLRLLRDRKLKNAISRYYGLADDNRQWDAMVRQQQGEYWSQIAGLLPRAALRAVMGRRDVVLSPLEISSIVAEARTRPALHDHLTAMAAFQEWIRHDSQRLARETAMLRSQLRQHLATAG